METKEEIWKPVRPPYHELYVVSNFGRVKTVKTGHILGFSSDEAGYRRVTLSQHNKSRKRALDIVVAEAFIPNPLNKPTVDHKDRDPTNNQVENLEWATRKEQSANRKPAKSIGNGVLKIDIKGKEISGFFPNTRAAASYFNVVPGLISRWIKRKHITSDGYQLLWSNQSERGEDLPGEEWKTVTIEGVEFKVSSFGRLENKQGLRYVGANHASGYKILNGVPLGNGKKKSFMVNRIICEAFHGPPPFPDAKAEHKDTNKHNNRADNLEWLTNRENVKRAYAALGDEHGTIKLAKPVMQLDMDGNIIHIFKSTRAATAFNKNIPENQVTKSMKTAIAHVCQGKRNEHHGFRWQYCDKSIYEKWKREQYNDEPPTKKRKVE